MLRKPSIQILAVLVVVSVASGGNGTKSNNMAACRSALQTYGEVMGNLQSCAVVSILPSNICQNCLVPYLAVLREYKNLDTVQFSNTETCKQFYVNSAHFLAADSYMFTHTFEAAVNASSPFLRANCGSCYAGDRLSMDSDLKPAIEDYIKSYVDVKACFEKWAFVVDDTASPVCAHCSDAFQKSQELFLTTIMHNATDYLSFTKVCLDVADRYQELNHLYQKYDCNPNVRAYVDMGVEFGFGIAFLLIGVMFYGPTYSALDRRIDIKRKNSVYIRSQCSENMQGSRRRGTSSSSSDADSVSPSVYTITDNCPYPSTSTRTNQSMFNEDVTVATLKT